MRLFRDHSPSFARLPGECWIPVPLPPPRTKKLIYLAFLSFSSYEFLRTFRDLWRSATGWVEMNFSDIEDSRSKVRVGTTHRSIAAMASAWLPEMSASSAMAVRGA